MCIRTRFLSALALLVVACAVLAPTASAQSTSLVTARVAPVLGVLIAGDGSVAIGSTVDATVRRERVGRTIVVTVIPLV